MTKAAKLKHVRSILPLRAFDESLVKSFPPPAATPFFWESWTRMTVQLNATGREILCHHDPNGE